MKVFFNNIDKKTQPKIWENKKGMSVLYIPSEYLEDIMNKANELGLKYCRSREPVYGCVDPNTLERPLIGFAHHKYWFEVKIEDGEVND